MCAGREAAGPAGLCPRQLLGFIVSPGGPRPWDGLILYLPEIYAHFHLASYTTPDTVDAPRQVGSLVPTVRESASTFPRLTLNLPPLSLTPLRSSGF